VIKEDIEKLTVRTQVTRICDECGKKDKLTIHTILCSKIRRKTGKDYCKKCSYKFREHNQKIGSASPYWKGGVSINPTSGYLRINKTKEYLHKYIYGEFVGRKISKTEKIHHIDLDKLNNNVDNLYLCENKSCHSKVHSQMEELGYILLGEYIWFSREKHKYVLDKIIENNIIFEVKGKPTCILKDHNGKRYASIYIGYRKHQRYHRYLMERFLNRKLMKNEHVHHIDGEILNNDINNLIVVSKSNHKYVHNSLQKCISELYKTNMVKFEKGIYYV